MSDMAPGKRFLHVLIILLLAVSFCSAAGVGFGEDDFVIRRKGNIHSYGDNIFQIRSSQAGILEIKIHDNLCIYRTITEKIPAGDTEIHWDGCGYNREKLYKKKYTISATLTTVSGLIRTVSFDSAVEYPVQSLQYVLPSDGILHLDHPDMWFLEYRTVTNGTVIIELLASPGSTVSHSWSVAADGGRIARKTFQDINGKKEMPSPGDYTLRIYEYSCADEIHEFPFRVEQETPAPEPVMPTGEIMPDRTMSDQEIWNMMMKPSVVVDIDSFKHQDVYTEPDTGSASLGTLHGQSQGLKVIRIENDWAKIGAWNHEEAEYIEGWVPLSRLKTESPRGDYGILIDKQNQTMTVFKNGKPIDTLLVSTGRAERNSLYQETSAGCFLTGYHRVNFSTNGKKYDYVIQYDGGNLLHQTPYDWGQHKKDFTLGRAYLGAKASHACVRIQPEPGKGGVNAYWLFTHIPYHTRIIILDDPQERKASAEKLKRGKNEEADFSVLQTIKETGSISEEQVSITFGGCMIPGGTANFNNRKESFSSFLKNSGYEAPLKNLKNIFSEDDMTCVSLCCDIQKESGLFPADKKGTYIASAGTEQIFSGASIELVRAETEKTDSGRNNDPDATEEAVAPFACIMDTDRYSVHMIKGHRIGFAGCTENEYIKDPEIIDRKMEELAEAGCEKKVMLFSWSGSNETEHSIIQEAMAHRSIRAGADLVVGNSRGSVLGIDMFQGVPVIYGLGYLLDGSTSEKPKNQQGMLVRAVFCFNESGTDLTVIPIMPYGASDASGNEYSPSSELSYMQSLKVIRSVWQDSPLSFLEKIRFFVPDQL